MNFGSCGGAPNDILCLQHSVPQRMFEHLHIPAEKSSESV